MKVDMSATGITARLKEMDELWVLSMKLVSAGRSLPKPNTKPAKLALEIFGSIKQVLIRDWDPIGIGDEEVCGDEYDAYVAPVYRILIDSRSENDLIEELRRIEVDEIGVMPTDVERLRFVALKLLSLSVRLDVSESV
jgi:hypothetical protein